MKAHLRGFQWLLLVLFFVIGFVFGWLPVLLLLMLMGAFRYLLHARKALAGRAWPRTQGVAVGPADIVVETTYSFFKSLKTVQIPYTYSVEGREYSADRVLFGDLATQEQVGQLLGKYPPGKKVVVHYNPQNLQEAVLEPVFLWSNLGNLGLVLAFLVALVLVFLLNSNAWYAASLFLIVVFGSGPVYFWHDSKISFRTVGGPAEGGESPAAWMSARFKLVAGWSGKTLRVESAHPGKQLPLTHGQSANGFLFFWFVLGGAIAPVLLTMGTNLAPMDLPSGENSFRLIAVPVLAVLTMLALRHRLVSWHRKYLPFVRPTVALAGLGFVFVSVCMFATVAANALLDTGAAETHTGTVIAQWREPGHNLDLRLEDKYERVISAAWSPAGTVRVRVSPAEYEKATKGTEVHLQIRPGFFGLPWVAGYELGEAPPPETAVEKPEKPAPSPAEAHLERAFDYHHEKQFDRAIAEYNRALELDPANADAYFWRGIAYEGAGEVDRALADWRQTIALDPDYVRAYIVLGQRLQDRNEFAASVRYLTRAIELEPGKGDHYYDRGRAYYGLGDLESALRDAKKGCDLGYQPACQIYERHKNRLR